MQLVQLLLPLYDNRGRRTPRQAFDQTAQELSGKFGGLTAYTRAPAKGLWKKPGQSPSRDDLVIYEVMCKRLETKWWQRFRRELESRFKQERIVIRAQRCTEI